MCMKMLKDICMMMIKVGYDFAICISLQEYFYFSPVYVALIFSVRSEIKEINNVKVTLVSGFCL